LEAAIMRPAAVPHDAAAKKARSAKNRDDAQAHGLPVCVFALTA
jgi:hypothetical protein